MITVYTTGATFTYRDGDLTKLTLPGFVGVFKSRSNMTSPELLGEHKAKTVVAILHKEKEEI